MLRRVVVAPVTTTVRDIPTEVPLGVDEGLPVESAASLDNIETLPKARLVRRVGILGASREHEVCAAPRDAVDC
jgi:mRNA interferase MazF